MNINQLDDIARDLHEHKRDKHDLITYYIESRLSYAYLQYSKELIDKYKYLNKKDYRSLRKIYR